MATPAVVLVLVSFLIYFVFIGSVTSFTHWVVTEDGKIQEQVYSVFYMRHPHDLVALMQQEKRSKMVEKFMNQLDGQIEVIDSQRVKDTNVQDKFYLTDKDCIMAEKPLTEYNMFVSTAAPCSEVQISIEDLFKSAAGIHSGQEPNCTRMSDLDFSMHTFEHLQAMRDRHKLSISPEVELLEMLKIVENIESLGHLLHVALEKNNTSWVLYNIAGYYFRIIGDAFKAVECTRRALHFSPRELKHVTLLNLGNILHHAQKAEEASVVVLAAIDINPDEPLLYYALGNIYASLSQYNKSVEAYDNTLRLNPDFREALLRKHATLCYNKLEIALEAQHDSLQKTLMELGDFEQRLDFWQQQQMKLMQEQASLEVRIASQIDYAEWKIRQQLQNEVQKIKHVKVEDGSGQKGGTIKKKGCSRPLPNGMMPPGCGGQPIITNFKIHLGETSGHLLKEMQLQSSKLKEELLSRQSEFNIDLTSANEDHHSKLISKPKYPRRPSKSSLNDPPPKYLLPNWPTVDDCLVPKALEDIHLTLSAFIPPENKGIEVGRVLGALNDVPEDEGPPLCEVESNSEFHTFWDWIFANFKAEDEDILPIRNSFQKYINTHCGPMSLDEFGRRVSYAMRENLLPKWLLHHLAHLYWWAIGDLSNFSKCIVNTKVQIPRQYNDLFLVPAASLMGQGGLLPGAIYSAKFALQTNEFEPTTNKLLADLYVLDNNLKSALVHYRKVLQEEPEDEEAFDRYLWVACRLQVEEAERRYGTPDLENVQQESDEPVWIELDENEVEQHCSARGTNGDDSDCGQIGNGFEEFTDDNDEELTLAPHQLTQDEFKRDIKELIKGTGEMDTSDTGNGGGKESQRIHVKLSFNKGPVAEPPFLLSQVSSMDHATDPIEDDLLPDILLQMPERPTVSVLDESECKLYPQANFKHFTSTWLSVSAKGVIVLAQQQLQAVHPVSWTTSEALLLGAAQDSINDLMDTKGSVTGPPQQPYCDPLLPSTALTLDHLAGIKYRSSLVYSAETGLREALQTLWQDENGPIAVDVVGTRLAISLHKNSTSWVLSTLAALYWRVTGQADQAIICLREALKFAPQDMRDIPLISLANVFHRSGLYNDALIVANMALEISPGVVLIHFTLANIFAAKGYLDQARAYYETTLALQASFEPARDRLRAIYCSTQTDIHDHLISHG